jgi:terminase small subunit-like protein
VQGGKSKNVKHVTPKKTQRFLELVAEGYTVNHAAKAVGISRMAPYRLRDRNPKFAQKLAEAMEAGSDVMEDEVRRRAVEGTQKPVFYQGAVCGHIREYSDTLLIFALKARRPQKYREVVSQHNYNYDLTHATDEQLNRISAGEDPSVVLSTPSYGGTGETQPLTSERIN